MIVEYDEFAAAPDVARARAGSAVALFDWHPAISRWNGGGGDSAATDAAFAHAAHVARVRIDDTRLAAVGRWDEAGGRYLITAGLVGRVGLEICDQRR